MKNNTNFIHNFAYSIFNFKSYREFLSQGLFKAILYLFIVSAVFSTLGNISILNTFNDDITRLENKYIQESPEFELKNGVLTIDSEEPVIYKYTGDSPILSIFIKDFLIGDVLISDTSGNSDVSILNDYTNGTYIDSKSIYAKKNGEIIANIDFSQNNSLTLNKESLTGYFQLFKNTFDIVLLIVNPIVKFLDNLISVFVIIGPMTLILSRNLKQKLSYRESSIIGIYAMTLPIILNSLMTVLDIYISEFAFIFYMLTLFYSIFAIRGINSTKKIDTIL
ncbi:MAG: DUF1189 domain-containing protein [Clostridium sp.]